MSPRPMPSRPEQEALVERSLRAYSRIHRRYERRHPEIFNPIEQARLRDALRRAVGDLPPTQSPPRGLDLGCGTGNVTGHLVDLGVAVTAADVIPQFLETVSRRFGSRVETLRLNGLDLAGVEDGGFDLVTAYSVLHHIPDYLGILDEIARVVRPGGLIYLDHEANEAFWDPDGCVAAFRMAVGAHAVARPGFWNPERRRWQRFLIPSRYVRGFKLRFDPESYWGVEGDIHTWPEDHIEWDLVEARLEANGCQVVRREDYLHYSAEYPDKVYDEFSADCADMRLVLARRGPAGSRPDAHERSNST